jgi:D-amino peptidase
VLISKASEHDYSEFQEQMTNEVNAACKGALSAGATEIFIKDAHGSGRNILGEKLPECVKLIRGWGEHPYGMLQELDKTFNAVLMIGYHSYAGSDQSPLSHTFNNNIYTIKINGTLASEFILNSYTAALENIPVVFVAGDEGICKQAKAFIKGIRTVSVKSGVGNSTINIHPQLAIQEIEDGVKQSLLSDISSLKIKLPARFKIEIELRNHLLAQKASYFPGVIRNGSQSITFESDNYFEILRMLMFVV